MRLRAIYFDDKHCYYRIYYDYLIPIETKTESFELTECVSEIFNERCEEGQFWIPDIMFYNVNIYSDNYDRDDKSYYAQYIKDFHYGIERNADDNKYRVVKKDEPFRCTEEIKDESFDKFINKLETIEYMHILNKCNSKIEDIGYFFG